MRKWPLMLTILAVAALLAGPADARIHDEEMCWAPDSEWPVPCDEDE